jgi:hypothetical protein
MKSLLTLLTLGSACTLADAQALAPTSADGVGKKRVVDSTGRFVGQVLSDTPTEALIEVRFRRSLWKLVVTAEGVVAAPAYSTQFFASSDCTGPAYSSAARFDGKSFVSIWGSGYLLRNSRTASFEFPRVGALPADVNIASLLHPSAGCLPLTLPTPISVYLETDLEPIDPLAGTVPPYKIAH